MNKNEDLIELEENIKELKDNLVFDITGLQSCEITYGDNVCEKSPVGTCVYDNEDAEKCCVFCGTVRPSLTLEDCVSNAKKYINEKIRRSFKYDYGFDMDHPSDRLFTETVIEMQLIESLLDGTRDLDILERRD